MVEIQRVSTNINGDPSRPETIALGNRVTALCGPTGSGKSRWVQALAWALTDRMDDAGRENAVKASREIEYSRPPGATEVYVELLTDSGSMRQVLGMNAETGSPKQHPSRATSIPGFAVADMNFPVRMVAEWLAKAPENTWGCFLPYIAAGVRAEDIGIALGPNALVVVNKVTGLSLKPPATLEQLQTLHARARTDKATTGKLIKVAEAERDGARLALGTTATPSEIKEQEDLVGKMANALNRAIAARARVDLARKAEESAAKVTHAESVLDIQFPDPGSISREAEGVALIKEGARMLERAKAIGFPYCPITGQTWDTVTWNLPKLAEVSGRLDAKHQTWTAARDARAKAVTFLDGMRRDLAALRAALPEVDPKYAIDDPTLAKWTEQHAAAQMRLQEMRVSQNAFTIVSQKDVEISRLGDIERAWSTLDEACDAAVKTLMQQRLDRFIKVVQEAIPTRYKVRIDTDEAGTPIFRPWLEDTKHKATGRRPSGGQRAMLLIALARAVLMASATPPAVAILALPEERGLDARRFGDLCRTLARLDGPQVVLTNIEPPKGKLPDTVLVHMFEDAEDVVKRAGEAAGKAGEPAQPGGEPAVADPAQAAGAASADIDPADLFGGGATSPSAAIFGTGEPLISKATTDALFPDPGVVPVSDVPVFDGADDKDVFEPEPFGNDDEVGAPTFTPVEPEEFDLSEPESAEEVFAELAERAAEPVPASTISPEELDAEALAMVAAVADLFKRGG